MTPSNITKEISDQVNPTLFSLNNRPLNEAEKVIQGQVTQGLNEFIRHPLSHHVRLTQRRGYSDFRHDREGGETRYEDNDAHFTDSLCWKVFIVSHCMRE